MKRVVMAGLVMVVLGCGGAGGGSGVCKPALLEEAINEGNPNSGIVTRHTCQKGHAVARARFDCDGCKPHVDYFLARKGDGWEVVGAGDTLDADMCEENGVMPYDDCVALFESF